MVRPHQGRRRVGLEKRTKREIARMKKRRTRRSRMMNLSDRKRSKERGMRDLGEYELAFCSSKARMLMSACYDAGL